MDVSSVLIIANTAKEPASSIAAEIAANLEKRGVATRQFLYRGQALDIPDDETFDLAITLGGDGTVLFASRVRMIVKPIRLLGRNMVRTVVKTAFRHSRAVESRQQWQCSGLRAQRKGDAAGIRANWWSLRLFRGMANQAGSAGRDGECVSSAGPDRILGARGLS